MSPMATPTSKTRMPTTIKTRRKKRRLRTIIYQYRPERAEGSARESQAYASSAYLARVENRDEGLFSLFQSQSSALKWLRRNFLNSAAKYEAPGNFPRQRHSD